MIADFKIIIVYSFIMTLLFLRILFLRHMLEYSCFSADFLSMNRDVFFCLNARKKNSSFPLDTLANVCSAAQS